MLSGPSPAALVAAVASALGFVASVYQLFGPKPYSAEQGREDRAHQNKSFAAADGRQQSRDHENLGDHHRTQAEVAALREQIAVLADKIGETNPVAAGPLRKTLDELADSDSASDFAIVEEAVSGNVDGAFARLIAAADGDKSRAAERYRQAARLIAPYQPAQAMDAYRQAVDLDPADLWSWIELGRLRAQYDTLAAARNCFGQALQHVTDERDRGVLHDEFGDVLVSEGHLPEARQEFEAGLAIFQRLADSDPHNTGWQRDLSVSHNKLGDLETSAGNLAGARTRFEASLAIRQRLADSDPHNTGWQRDLSTSHERLGDLAEGDGRLEAALAHFLASLPIATRLAGQWPDHPQFASDLAITRRRIGELEQRLAARGA